MLTVWCLSVAFLSPWVVGAPLTWLLHGCRPLRPTQWLWVPFVGLAGIICVLQNLVYFADLPLRRTTGWFWLGVALSWLVMLSAPSGRKCLRSFPTRVFALTLAVYLLQGIGVVTQGVEWFHGNMLTDQFQYVALAQFLVSEPLSTGWPDVGERAWLVIPLCLKDDRLGQSIVHAFFATTAGREPLDLYFPTQLLGAALLVPAGTLLAREFAFPRWLVQWVAVAMGLAPVTALLAGRCYLSHVLCIPILIAFLAGVIRLSRGGGGRPTLGAATAFQLGFAVYTEFVPLFLGTAAAALATGWLFRHVSLWRILGVGAGLILAVCANPAALFNAITVARRSVDAGPGMTLEYPTSVWLTTFWLHTGKAIVVVLLQPPRVSLVWAYVFAGALLAVGGFVSVLHRAIVDNKRRIALAGCYSLLVPPVAIWLLRPQSTYVMGKLLWTVAPLVVLSVAFALQALTQYAQSTHRERMKRVVRGVAAFLVLIFGVQSYYEQRTFLRDSPSNPAISWHDPDLREIRDELRRRPSSDVVIALDEERKPSFPAAANTAICYDGRQHSIRLASPQRIWHTDIEQVPTPQLAHLSNVPAGTLVVVSGNSPLIRQLRAEVIVANKSYQLIRLVEPVDGSVTQLLMSDTARR